VKEIIFRNKVQSFNTQQLEAIANILGDTHSGLTGSEIGRLLQISKIPDIDPTNTKRIRLCNAFAEFQNKHQVGNHVIIFINQAMNPVSYTEKAELFESRRLKLNHVLAMCGFELPKNGQVKATRKAKTINDALARSNKLKETLRQRNVHSDVLSYCNAEILQQNYFHAVLEAMKSITAKVRRLADLDEDGAVLVDQAFGFNQDRNPKLAINALDTKTRQGEQRGFMNLLKGLYGTVRNPLAHEAKIEWDDMSEEDAVDILTMISLIHRKLDKTSNGP
jgi:uncharacterized protein (TIGR02391 family)